MRDYRRLQTAYFRLGQTTGFNPRLQKALAKRLAVELNFSAAEIQGLSFSEMVWWLTD